MDEQVAQNVPITVTNVNKFTKILRFFARNSIRISSNFYCSEQVLGRGSAMYLDIRLRFLLFEMRKTTNMLCEIVQSYITVIYLPDIYLQAI